MSRIVQNVDLDAQPDTAALGFYTMHTGELRPLSCCNRCDNVEDGIDYRLYVDASTYGNVRSIPFEVPVSSSRTILVYALHRK